MDPTEARKANIDFHRSLAKSYQEQPFFRPENQQRVRSLLAELAAETGGGWLLDVGCGTGFIFDLAHDLFKQLEGVDITPEMMERIVPRTNVRVQLAPAEQLPFEDGEFDVLTMYSVLHHLPDLSAVFREARRVLRVGGVFYADESPSQHHRAALLNLSRRIPLGGSLAHELDSLTRDADEFLTRYGIDPKTTRRAMVQNYELGGLTEENLRTLLDDAGFRSVDIHFRRFSGEDDLKARSGDSAVEVVQQYLQEILPLTRHLFKYFVLTAR